MSVADWLTETPSGCESLRSSVGLEKSRASKSSAHGLPLGRWGPLTAASERSPAQVVISGGMLCIWLGEEKSLSVLTCLAGTGSVGSVSRCIKNSSQHGPYLVASSNSGAARICKISGTPRQDHSAFHEGPSNTSFEEQLLERLAEESAASLPLLLRLGSAAPFRVRGGPMVEENGIRLCLPPVHVVWSALSFQVVCRHSARFSKLFQSRLSSHGEHQPPQPGFHRHPPGEALAATPGSPCKPAQATVQIPARLPGCPKVQPSISGGCTKGCVCVRCTLVAMPSRRWG